jgi:hypothetical protein
VGVDDALADREADPEAAAPVMRTRAVEERLEQFRRRPVADALVGGPAGGSRGVTTMSRAGMTAFRPGRSPV